jgi:ferritin
MITDAMKDAINAQINKEMYSAYLYLSMSSYAEANGFKGVGAWFKQQTYEEMQHAMKFYDYLGSQGAQPVLDTIEKPPAEFDSVKDLFEKSLEHEQFVTKSINDLVDVARENKDNATEIFLQWFVTEQVEEEESVQDILDRLELIGDAKGGLFMLDRELSQRGAGGGHGH